MAIKNPDFKQSTTAIDPDQYTGRAITAGGEIGMSVLTGAVRNDLVKREDAALASFNAESARLAIDDVTGDTGVTDRAGEILGIADKLDPFGDPFIAAGENHEFKKGILNPQTAGLVALGNSLDGLAKQKRQGSSTDTQLAVQLRQIRKSAVDKYPGLINEINQQFNNFFGYDERVAQAEMNRVAIQISQQAKAEALVDQREAIRTQAKDWSIDINLMDNPDPEAQALFLRQYTDMSAQRARNAAQKALVEQITNVAELTGKETPLDAKKRALGYQREDYLRERAITVRQVAGVEAVEYAARINADPEIVALRDAMNADPTTQNIAAYNGAVGSQMAAVERTLRTQSRSFIEASTSEQAAIIAGARAVLDLPATRASAFTPEELAKTTQDRVDEAGTNQMLQVVQRYPQTAMLFSDPELVRTFDSILKNSALGSAQGRAAAVLATQGIADAMAMAISPPETGFLAPNPLSKTRSQREAREVVKQSGTVLADPKLLTEGRGLASPGAAKATTAAVRVAIQPFLDPNTPQIGDKVNGGRMKPGDEMAVLKNVSLDNTREVIAWNVKNDPATAADLLDTGLHKRTYRAVSQRLENVAKEVGEEVSTIYTDGLDNYFDRIPDTENGGYIYSQKMGSRERLAQRFASREASPGTLFPGNDPTEAAAVALARTENLLNGAFGSDLGIGLKALYNADPLSYKQDYTKRNWEAQMVTQKLDQWEPVSRYSAANVAPEPPAPAPVEPQSFDYDTYKP